MMREFAYMREERRNISHRQRATRVLFVAMHRVRETGVVYTQGAQARARRFPILRVATIPHPSSKDRAEVYRFQAQETSQRTSTAQGVAPARKRRQARDAAAVHVHFQFSSPT